MARGWDRRRRSRSLGPARGVRGLGELALRARPGLVREAIRRAAPALAALAVFGKQSDTERLLARVEQMLGVGCRSVGVFEPTPGLQKSLIGFSSVHFLFQGATLLRAFEELLRDGGLRR